MSSKRLYIKTFGCQMNDYDSAKMADVLAKSHGYERTLVAEEADLLLLNTCSVREKAQEKVFSELGRWREWKAGKPDRLIGVGGCVASQEGEAIARDLRSTLESASGAAKALEDTLNEARPATRQLTESTLPAAEATLRDLRATSKALRDVTETIDEKGAGALLSSQPLPDYKP